MADAMRYLFDSQAPLHQHLFQSLENNTLKVSYDPDLADRISPEEKTWRKALVSGSKVDALKTD